jgi:pimeloyl-ACP methyl ester carboxylesterase
MAKCSNMNVRPFEVQIGEEILDDLRARLSRTRWPDEIADAGWDYGTNLAYMRELVGYWQGIFDWREQEERLNRLAHFRAEVSGFGVHFIHERGKGPDPMPLMLTHGWPSTFFEFSKIIPLLTDPERHGGEAVDAFDVVVPSLPGYGFSDRPIERDFSRRIPELWVRLMEELGYPRFAAHGVDVGASVANLVGLWYPNSVIGIHVTYPAEPYTGPGARELSERERELLEGRPRGQEAEGGYTHIQRTKPQTLSYALDDSPAGLAAWIVEKFRAWSDCDGDVERRFSKEELLTNLTIYWATETIGSSFRIYRDWALGAESNPYAWEGREEVPRGVASKPLARDERIEVPSAVALFPADPPAGMPREWAERSYSDLRRFSRMPKGGHFPAMEEPELLVEDIRSFLRPLR